MCPDQQNSFRNVAIIAHVDHGKTTLIDAMLRDSKIFRDNQHINDQIMDSNPQERERGITILAKNTAIQYEGTTLNIIDTPGHVDFSGEVERVVNMADGCLLVVDAGEGPMPQTRYVLKVAMKSGLKPVVVVNKIDRPVAEIETTVEAVNDLFLDLATDAEQLEFPILYASGKEGYALANLTDKPTDMTPLFNAIVQFIPAPQANTYGTFQMLVTSLDYDNHLGQIAIGRVSRGIVHQGEPLVVIDKEGIPIPCKADHLFSFRDLGRHEVISINAGDIGAITGIKSVTIGDTIASAVGPEPLKRITIEEPTVKMTFGVNTSPFSGKDGKYATSRVLWSRLQKEIQTNVSLRIEQTTSADEFIVSGRGELHLSVLIEDMRREGLEFQVSRPEAILKQLDGKIYEPFERILIDTPEEFIGVLTEELASRLGQLHNIQNDGKGNVQIEYIIPTRGLIGFRSFLLRSTRGSAVMNSELLESHILKGSVKSTRFGAIVSTESGIAFTYGIKNAQERGQTFISPNTPVYEGMIVGMHNRDGDLELNICKEKKLTNVRSSTADVFERLEPPVKFSLEETLDFVSSDELAEITPVNIRMRKKVLNKDERYRIARSRTKR
ncbi:translational GTPase TypA [SAR202 cluster bacterium AD-802-E10_MRT_200m]|nr:translational GTPase TypA [SAR202 cluster bacterium AD-802-E10_MRT_200m]MQF82589.1 translational GTPase TypA [SAR202 cluster bacterium AD-802-E10_MRT_200m]